VNAFKHSDFEKTWQLFVRSFANHISKRHIRNGRIRNGSVPRCSRHAAIYQAKHVQPETLYK
jgi:hypothetical protein